MKKSILSLLFFSISVFAYMIPSWYPNNETTTITSYGDGESLEDAKLQALEDTKDQLVKKGILWPIATILQNDLSIEQEEVLENRYFIQTSFDTLTTEDKINDIMKQQVFKTEDENNSYLIKTQLFQNLYTKYGYYPHISLDTNQNKYIGLLGNKISLTKADKDMFYVVFKDENISLEVKQSLFPNETYFINVESIYNGYLNIIQLSDNYDVVVLLENKELSNSSSIIFPNFKESDGLVATLDGYEVQNFYTLAIVCESQKDFSGFNNLFSTEIKTGKIGKFIETISDCKFSSVESTIEQEKSE
ncbi:MAG TPA: hypothetical protein ENK66_06045 [Arcobacter sp.]|jgi:hypothetical protein|nr:hypothetical protein [Arcobacter sp.]